MVEHLYMYVLQCLNYVLSDANLPLLSGRQKSNLTMVRIFYHLLVSISLKSFNQMKE